MKISLIVLFFLSLNSCEEIIDLDLNEAPPKLVVDTHINRFLGTSEAQSAIRLTTTAPYFDHTVPSVTDAIVQVIDQSDNIHPFVYSEDGYYYGNFIPSENEVYNLKVLYKEDIYTASALVARTVSLDSVAQKNEGGFFGDRIELKVYFTDPPDKKNFYYFTGSSEKGDIRSVFKDEFFDGNTIFAMYTAEDLEPSDEVQFILYGITEEYYNYLSLLLQQTGGMGGPFESQPATVRGNIVNKTNPDDYALGYFQMAEISVLEYTVE